MDKAVVEVETEEGGAHTLLPRDGGLDDGFDGVENLRACFLVVAGAQLSGGTGRQERHRQQQTSDDHNH